MNYSHTPSKGSPAPPVHSLFSLSLAPPGLRLTPQRLKLPPKDIEALFGIELAKESTLDGLVTARGRPKPPPPEAVSCLVALGMGKTDAAHAVEEAMEAGVTDSGEIVVWVTQRRSK